MKFTILEMEQILGDKALDVMKKYGIYAAPTDLAVILGGGIQENKKARTPEGDFPCLSWTKSPRYDNMIICSPINYMTDPTDMAKLSASMPYDRSVSVRPVLPPEEAANIQLNKIKSKISGVDICTYGEYPQTLADEQTSQKLEKLYEDCKLDETGKKYTFDSESDAWMEPDKTSVCEFELDGKKYIRIEVRICQYANHEPILSSGERVEKGKPYWVRVEPIEWLQDKTGTLISKKCLFAGIRFNSSFKKEWRKAERDYFPDTEMQWQLDNYFAKEIIDSETKKLQKERNPRQEAFGITPVKEKMSTKEQIEYMINMGYSFRLLGPSGIGKTRRIKEIDPDLTSITLCNGIMPEEVIGRDTVPNVSFADIKDAITGVSGAFADSKVNKEELGETIEKAVKEAIQGKMIGGIWRPPSWYTELCRKCAAEPNKKHILFIDEVTNARENTQSLIYKIAREGCIAEGKGVLPGNAVVVLAGNRKTETAAAYNWPGPLQRRMFGTVDLGNLKVQMKEWIEWGSEPSKTHPDNPPGRLNIHPLITNFVASKGVEAFYSEYDEGNPPDFTVDPRKWEMVSDMIYDSNGHIRLGLLEISIGKDLAASLFAYAENPPLSAKEIIDGKYTKDDIPKEADACHALICNLRYVSPKQVEKVRNFIKDNLKAENLAVFDSLWVGKDDMRALQIAELRKHGGR